MSNQKFQRGFNSKKDDEDSDHEDMKVAQKL